jgi:hypothetical protein
VEGCDDAEGSIEAPEEPLPPHDAQLTAARMAITNLIAGPSPMLWTGHGSKTPLTLCM